MIKKSLTSCHRDGSNIDITSFLERDIKIVVGCIKPYEVKLLDPFFSLDSDDINYIYSFVDRSLWDGIRQEMGKASGRTYFAGYAPDIFRYAGDNHIYGAILPETVVPEREPAIQTGSDRGGLLSRIFQLRITKEEIHGTAGKREQELTV